MGLVTTWEYLEILVVGEAWFDTSGDKGANEMLNARTTQGRLLWSTPVARLQQLGQIGWELAGVLPAADLGGYKLFFKRAAAQQLDEIGDSMGDPLKRGALQRRIQQSS